MRLRKFSKFLVLSTLFLIFAGGMVTSTDSGLAVPDWPLSYGSLFPPMIGGVFYEHGHRMVASFVGLMTLCFAVCLWKEEKRKWVKNLGLLALVAVITQGLLGGLTVKFMLPTPVSVTHAVLAQTFFILTIIIAYSLSDEREKRRGAEEKILPGFLWPVVIIVFLIYTQLIFGAVMRHTHSGLAIPDFPQMGGQWIPRFNNDMLIFINSWRFNNDLDPVNMHQIIFHFIHRMGAVIIVLAVCILNVIGLRYKKEFPVVMNTLLWLDCLILIQILLGIMSVLSLKAPIITSIHVMTGAATLGTAVLLFLRSAPLGMDTLKRSLYGTR